MNKYIARIQTEIKLKTGEIIPVGTECKLSWPQDPRLTQCEIGEKSYTFKTRNCARYFDWEVPTMEMLEEAVPDGVCTTVLGNTTEPDGTDEYGSPSWLLVMGLI